jgi:hypothetical protein
MCNAILCTTSRQNIITKSQSQNIVTKSGSQVGKTVMENPFSTRK